VSGAATITVLMPNSNGVRSNTWQQYQTTVSSIASRTGCGKVFLIIAPKARENPDQFANIGMNQHQKGEKQDDK